jgi:hypothetical protein
LLICFRGEDNPADICQAKVTMISGLNVQAMSKGRGHKVYYTGIFTKLLFYIFQEVED